jgi:hypothetical protein
MELKNRKWHCFGFKDNLSCTTQAQVSNQYGNLSWGKLKQVGTNVSQYIDKTLMYKLLLILVSKNQHAW